LTATSVGSRGIARLHGARVLVVEDEIMIALDIDATLVEAGAAIVTLCTTMAEAMAGAASGDFSVATLDIRLGGVTSAAVAELLDRRGIPFIFYSGQSLPEEMTERWPDNVLISKPADPDRLVDIIAALLR
jgi:DNA-binding NtrC family response regulator